MPPLFRQRTLYLPTWPLVLLTLMLLVLCSSLILKQLGQYLAPHQVVNQGVLIVEGWQNKKALETSYARYRQGNYSLLVTTGGPITNNFNGETDNYARRSARYLVKLGLPENQLLIADAPASAQDRTFLSAVIARNKLLEHKPNENYADIVTSGVHARRTHRLYKQAFSPSYTLGIIALTPERYSLEHWWKTSEGTKTVLNEIFSLAYAYCCFHPGAPGSRQEMWAGAPSLKPEP